MRLSVALSRPSVRPVAVSRVRGAKVVAMATPSKDISKKIEDAIKDAKDTCAKDAEACATAWDTVEELSAAKSDSKQKEKENSDPLEQFCNTSPDADECRIHDN